jgi:hypothetical protein
VTAGNYSVHNFYAEVLNLILNVSADLVYPALNNVLSELDAGRVGSGPDFCKFRTGRVGSAKSDPSPTLRTLGLDRSRYGWSRSYLGLGTVGLGLELGLGRPGLDNMTAEIRARLLPRRNMVAVLRNDQRLLQCHEMTRSGQISAARPHSLSTAASWLQNLKLICVRMPSRKGKKTARL